MRQMQRVATGVPAVRPGGMLFFPAALDLLYPSAGYAGLVTSCRFFSREREISEE